MKYPLFTTKGLAERLVKQDGLLIDASTPSLPYNMLSPFFVWDKVIPVPEMEDFKSRTVEGIWQGLKLVNDKIDKSLFDAKKIKKRRVEPYGSCKFLFKGERINYVEARKKIYKPSYEWMFHNLLPRDLKESLYILAENNIQLYFFDVDDNSDIENTSSSFSHSSLLVDIINRELEKSQECKTDCSTK